MKSLRIFDRRIGSLLMAFAFLLAAVSPALIAPQVSAAQLLSRSIQLSTSKANADDVSYQVKFTTSANAGAFIVHFCTSPLVGSACTKPTGLDTASVSTADGSTTVSSIISGSGVKIVKSTTTGAQTINLDEIDNPTGVETFYARILTYDDSTAAGDYTTGLLTGTYIDDGAVALATTSSIGVTAAVLETMTFCVASATITANCANASSNLPAIELGEGSGAIKALSPTAVSTGTIYTQISTNAASGATINLKSSATSCGGLLRSGGGGACNITASSDGISNGQAEFGVKTATAYGTSGEAGASGTLAPVSASGYNSSTYFLDYVGGNATGVTSPYGDPFIDTAAAPANNQNMDLTFGASISNTTPAGLYTADINLIATGLF